jgi:hypothetical protein
MIVSAENNCGWLVLLAAHGPAVYRAFSVAFDEVVFARFGPSLTTTQWPTRPTLKPSESFPRLMHCSFIGDPFGIASRHWIGVDNIVWCPTIPTPPPSGRTRAILSSVISGTPASRKALDRQREGRPTLRL